MFLRNFIIISNKNHLINSSIRLIDFRRYTNNQKLNMSQPTEVIVDTQKLLKSVKTIVPSLSNNKHKGQFGRIGIVGGSLEYTGAPYFAAISSLRVGADLAHVFCQKDAAPVIKSYSPELIVHPLLDDENAIEKITPWLERLHVLIIGPGLGKDCSVQKTALRLMKLCIDCQKPMIIDADGLSLLNDNFDLICGLGNIILTPNAIEFRRLFGEQQSDINEKLNLLGNGVLVLQKGARDRIYMTDSNETFILPEGGSGRRCGGQGDLLSGALATFYNWALQSSEPNPGFVASFAACYLVKSCNAAAFIEKGRSMLASDMIDQISPVFKNNFERNEELPKE